MSANYQFYLNQPAPARGEAEAATLDNVRDRCLRSAAAWDSMAARLLRTEKMRVETDARKKAEALSQQVLECAEAAVVG